MTCYYYMLFIKTPVINSYILDYMGRIGCIGLQSSFGLTSSPVITTCKQRILNKRTKQPGKQTGGRGVIGCCEDNSKDQLFPTRHGVGE